MTKRLTIALVALAMFVLVAIMPASASFYYTNTSINQSASVFIGEQGLNITAAQNAFDHQLTGFYPATIGWWASAANVATSTPQTTVPLTANTSFMISYSAFGGYTGPWYVLNTTTGFGDVNDGALFNVKDPQISADVWDLDQGTQGGIAVTGASIIQGDNLTIKIGTNMDTAIDQPTLRSQNLNPSVDTTGWADIKVKTDSGNTLSALLNQSGNATSITAQSINAPAWYWSNGGAANHADATFHSWNTGAIGANGQFAYPGRYLHSHC